MIVVPTAPWAHYLGDAAAWATGAAAGYWQHRRWPAATADLSRRTEPGYFLALGIGALLGAWLLGSANSMRSLHFTPSHSIGGALAGGIVAVELWKWRHGIRQSTGGAFVLPLCVGIAVGRFGCLFAGLPDFTYGVPTGLPWAVDLGDGIGRHPVQLYEAGSMALFAAVYLRARLERDAKKWAERRVTCLDFRVFRKKSRDHKKIGRHWAEAHAFHAMIIVYAAQRFLWEFLKPYPTVIGPLNIFHILMLGLIVYGFVWWRRGDDQPIAAIG